MAKALDYRDFCHRVRLLPGDRISRPSIQLAEFCEAHLPAGAYRVDWSMSVNRYVVHVPAAAAAELARASSPEALAVYRRLHQTSWAPMSTLFWPSEPDEVCDVPELPPDLPVGGPDLHVDPPPTALLAAGAAERLDSP